MRGRNFLIGLAVLGAAAAFAAEPGVIIAPFVVEKEKISFALAAALGTAIGGIVVVFILGLIAWALLRPIYGSERAADDARKAVLYTMAILLAIAYTGRLWFGL